MPTSVSNLSIVKNTVVKRLHPSEVSKLDHVTPELICHCTCKLKPGKGDGNERFKSGHIIHSGQSLNYLLPLLFSYANIAWSLSPQFISFQNYSYTKGFKVISLQC